MLPHGHERPRCVDVRLTGGARRQAREAVPRAVPELEVHAGEHAEHAKQSPVVLELEVHAGEHAKQSAVVPKVVPEVTVHVGEHAEHAAVPRSPPSSPRC